MTNTPLQQKLKNVLSGTTYCSICLESSSEVYSLQTNAIVKDGAVLTFNNILEGVFQDMTSNMLFGEYICHICKTSAVDAYNFMTSTKMTAKIYETYLKQLQTQIEQIDRNSNPEFNSVTIILDDFANVLNNHKVEIEDGIIDNGGSASCHACNSCVKEEDTKKHVLKHLNHIKCTKYKKYSKCPHCLSDSCIHQKYLISFNTQKICKRGKEKVKCLDCQFDCDSLKAMLRHVNKEHLQMKSFCDLCGRVFYYRTNLIEHIKKCQRAKKIFKCENCSATFESKFHATMHKREHAEVRWKCYVCSKWFLEKKNLSQHIAMFHIFDSYNCSVCQEDCGDEINLYFHLKTHKPGEKHRCVLCDVEFNGRTHYIEHVKTTKHLRKVKGEKEIENRQVLCTICHMKCEDMSAYLAHKKTHKPEEKHRCNVCDLVFDTKLQYTRHSRLLGHKRNADPEKLQALKCNYCDFKTYSRASLELHINCKHLSYMPHECHVCGKGFATSNALESHVKRHTAKIKQSVVEKGCDVCGKWFRSKIAWQKHMRLHTGERPYPCDLCDQAFISASHRTAHKYRQHMEKTFRCPICETLFHTIGNVRSHVRKSHWKKSEKFDYKKLDNLNEEVEELFRDRRLLQ